VRFYPPLHLMEENRQQIHQNMKTLLLTAFVLFNLVAFAQDDTKQIKKINTIEQANAFITANPKLSGEIIEFNTGTDSSALAKKIVAANRKQPLTIGGYTYKVVEVKKSFLLRVSYIFLDGSKLSMSQVDSLRKAIIFKYNNGTTFPELAKEYDMAGTPDCDLGWAPEGMLVNEFSSAVKAHKKGEIFTIDVPDKQWYHVTLKTFDDKEVKIYTVLKVKNGS
jgi:hypothetical protein